MQARKTSASTQKDKTTHPVESFTIKLAIAITMSKVIPLLTEDRIAWGREYSVLGGPGMFGLCTSYLRRKSPSRC